jgi:hypothetical protein
MHNQARGKGREEREREEEGEKKNFTLSLFSRIMMN